MGRRERSTETSFVGGSLASSLHWNAIFIFFNLGEDDSNENTDTESEETEKLHMESLSWMGDMEVGVENVSGESCYMKP